MMSNSKVINLDENRFAWRLKNKDKRSASRQNVVRIATLEIGSQQLDCYVVDLSRYGAKIRTLNFFTYKDTNVRMHITGIGSFDAEIVRKKGKEIGICFKKEVDLPQSEGNAKIEDILRVYASASQRKKVVYDPALGLVLAPPYADA